MTLPLSSIIQKYQDKFQPIVPFSAGHDKLIPLDLGSENSLLTPDIYTSLPAFSAFINRQLADAGAKYGIGGYLENRSVYSASEIFDVTGKHKGLNSARSLHLGVDIWGPAGTPVTAPWGGSVHSLAFNDRPGDYGATIILQHQLEGISFYTLYGHLSLKDLEIGQMQYVSIGQTFGSFGEPAENGGWPPHLHFQIIIDLEGKQGDYPGVCSPEQEAHYAQNCPNPDLMLNMMRHIRA